MNNNKVSISELKWKKKAEMVHFHLLPPSSSPPQPATPSSWLRIAHFLPVVSITGSPLVNCTQGRLLVTSCCWRSTGVRQCHDLGSRGCSATYLCQVVFPGNILPTSSQRSLHFSQLLPKYSTHSIQCFLSKMQNKNIKGFSLLVFPGSLP